MNKGIIKLNNLRQRNDDARYMDWYSCLVDVFYINSGKMDKYDAEIIRDYYAVGLSPEQTYKELLSELTIEEEE